ncbi:MAG TPA: flagellar hook-basal body complex protein FliE [Clostridiales bacterium]|jgi:flagellar hook-basal body complex protein FliE|nr:flagellar hook-basal body complex protein FliE [Clostridiales bacterium]
MNIQSIGAINELGKIGSYSADAGVKENRNAAFETLFDAAVNMIKETNRYTNEAEEAEMAFSLGLLDNTHDLQIAQQKANLALQFTIAVRNQVLDAYKEIMNLQF